MGIGDSDHPTMQLCDHWSRMERSHRSSHSSQSEERCMYSLSQGQRSSIRPVPSGLYVPLANVQMCTRSSGGP